MGSTVLASNVARIPTWKGGKMRKSNKPTGRPARGRSRYPMTSCLAAAGITAIPMWAAPASAHDLDALRYQYGRLSPDLAEELRALDDQISAARARGLVAADEDDRNLHELLDTIDPSASDVIGYEQIYIKSTLWKQNHEFKICFFDGNTVARKHVIELFADIIKNTNLRLNSKIVDCSDPSAARGVI